MKTQEEIDKAAADMLAVVDEHLTRLKALAAREQVHEVAISTLYRAQRYLRGDVGFAKAVTETDIQNAKTMLDGVLHNLAATTQLATVVKSKIDRDALHAQLSRWIDTLEGTSKIDSSEFSVCGFTCSNGSWIFSINVETSFPLS